MISMTISLHVATLFLHAYIASCIANHLYEHITYSLLGWDLFLCSSHLGQIILKFVTPYFNRLIAFSVGL